MDWIDQLIRETSQELNYGELSFETRRFVLALIAKIIERLSHETLVPPSDVS